jgi:hypothetical protein
MASLILMRRDPCIMYKRGHCYTDLEHGLGQIRKSSSWDKHSIWNAPQVRSLKCLIASVYKVLAFYVLRI